LLRWAICGTWEKRDYRTGGAQYRLAPGCNRIEHDEVKMYRLILFALATFVFLSGQFARAESDWLNDYKKAQEEAKASNKILLLNFTGSDWCGWCIKFDKEVLSQPQFKEYAHNNLVLVELDFPRAKAQSAELRKQNRQLAQQYEVVGFPTIIAVNSDGQKLWEYNGYFSGGPDAFIEELQKLRKG
jgi:thioredoxin-related protein